MSGISPTQRSKNLLTSQGYLAANVEAWKRFPKSKSHPCPTCGNREQIAVRSDLLGFADLICFHPVLRTIVLVQVTTRANHMARLHKILGSMEAKLALLAGCAIVVHSWKEATKGKRSWELTEEQVHLSDFDSAPHYPSSVEQLTEIKKRAKFLESNEHYFDNLPF